MQKQINLVDIDVAAVAGATAILHQEDTGPVEVEVEVGVLEDIIPAPAPNPDPDPTPTPEHTPSPALLVPAHQG